jgi:hypothetical protein
VPETIDVRTKFHKSHYGTILAPRQAPRWLRATDEFRGGRSS